MRVHKRKKNSRIRGARTVGWGFRQKHKGHGNKGGFGKAGTGKRADHDKQRAIASDKKKGYFGKQGLTSRGSARKKTNQINLRDIKDNFTGAKIDLSKHKILGAGDGFKAEITAKAASKLAIEKMEKAGGKIILPVVKEKKIVEKKEAKGEEKKEAKEKVE
jgi:large subunit ribosomal protein L15